MAIKIDLMSTLTEQKQHGLEHQNLKDYHILIEQTNDVWNAKLEDSESGEVLEFHRPIDLVRWLERQAKVEPTHAGLA